MKKTLLLLFLISSAVGIAQITLPYTQDFESETLGVSASTLSNPFTDEFTVGVGSSLIANGTMGANTSKLIASSATSYTSGSNHYFRSPAFSMTPGNTYTLSFDIIANGSNVTPRIRTSTDGSAFIVMGVALVDVSTTVGAVDDSKDKVTMGVNTATTITLEFTAPLGNTQFQLQVYQWGVKGFEFDNFNVIESAVASVSSIDNQQVQLQSNLINNSLTIDSEHKIIEATAINLTGTQVSLSSTDGETFDASQLASGLYILKVSLNNGNSHSMKFIKK